MTSHAPIMISGDSGFTSVNGVVAGTGVRADPYLIDGWIINSTISQIIVANCNNVEITHLSITNTDSAIQVANVSNLMIANSTLTMNRQSSISLSFVNNTTVQGVTATLNSGGIGFWHAINVTISDNT